MIGLKAFQIALETADLYLFMHNKMFLSRVADANINKLSFTLENSGSSSGLHGEPSLAIFTGT